MAGLSRRAFLAATAALSGAWALPSELLGSALAAPLLPAEAAPTTLRATIKQLATPQRSSYRTLVAAPGESYLTRIDLTGKEPESNRVNARRSLLYIGHLSDIHIIDAQAPARLEALERIAPVTMSAANRPQDTLTTNVLAAMVSTVSKSRYSPLTGAPLAAAFVTGDSADSHSSLELRWYIDLLDGISVTPDSGNPRTYDGVQIWPESTYAWHPDNPNNDIYGTYGYPQVPGLLNAAISQEVHSVALPVPWYAVYGNHDTTFMGNIAIDAWLTAWALGDRKYATPGGEINNMMVQGWVAESSAFQRVIHNLRVSLGIHDGLKTVPADPRRKLFDQLDFMREHLQTKSVPGPIGHGFTQHNLQTGQTWWKTDVGPYFRFFGLDTCNQITGADGAVPQTQFDWLKAELTQARTEKKICVVTSHHNSYTLENTAVATIGMSEPLIHASEFVAMLQEFPNLLVWLNGHTHINTITAHPKSGGGGFWEITTASCIDYPQQQQLVEFMDNRDGTISIFTTVLDHDSPAAWESGDLSQTGLASLSRELASNFWDTDPLQRIGSVYDRNCELVIPAPFDLAEISAADLEKTQAEQRARLIAYEQQGA